MKVDTGQCPLCKKASELHVDDQLAKRISRWRQARNMGEPCELIQHEFADLSVDMVEQIISGCHPYCWEATFGPMEH